MIISSYFVTFCIKLWIWYTRMFQLFSNESFFDSIWFGFGSYPFPRNAFISKCFYTILYFQWRWTRTFWSFLYFAFFSFFRLFTSNRTWNDTTSDFEFFFSFIRSAPNSETNSNNAVFHLDSLFRIRFKCAEVKMSTENVKKKKKRQVRESYAKK